MLVIFLAIRYRPFESVGVTGSLPTARLNYSYRVLTAIEPERGRLGFVQR